MSSAADRAQRTSDAAALALTGALIWALLVGHPFEWNEVSASRFQPDAPLELSLESVPIEAPAATPTPQPPPKQRQVIKPRTALVAAAAPAEPTPAVSEAIPEEAAVVAAPATPASEPPPRSSANADLEAQYAAALRDDIDRRTHSPDFELNHLRRVAGEVRVSFVVTRAGQPTAVALLHSSGTPSLDQSALAVVSSGHYAPMPAVIFANEPEHLFAVTIEFRAAARQAWAR